MKKSIYITFIISVLLVWRCTKSTDKKEKMEQVPFTQVHLNDSFWAPKIEVNRTVSIPSAFKKSEETGRMDNFAVAGGLLDKEHQGDFPFDDTDVYKILEGASYALAVKPDSDLDLYLDSLIYLIGEAQEDDGYLTTCVTNKCDRLRGWYGKGRWDKLNSHELYNSGHLYEAAVAHYLATGKRSLLDIAIKNADLVYKVFGPNEGQKHVPSGHPIIEMALVKLYNVTNDQKYLELARYFIDETGRGTDGHKLNAYSQDHMPIVDQEEAVGHAVRLGYLYSGVTDVASLMHDQQLMDASKRVWENIVSKKLYITGGIGQRAQGEGFGPNYELNNMTSYCETCASISNVYWNYRLFLHEGNSKYYDVLERTLYNGLISGVSLSGDHFFYDNPLESAHNHERAPWFGCACCPGNITRFMASVPGYIYTKSKDAVYVNLYAGGTASIPVGKDTLKLTQNTLYPWGGDVNISVQSNVSSKFKLKIRIPGWVKNKVVPSDLYHFVNQMDSTYTIKVNQESIEWVEENGYAVLSHNWKEGDVIDIHFPMEARKVVANDKVAYDKGKIAFQRGPVVFCFEDKDNNNEYVFDKYVDSGVDVKTSFEENLLGGVVTLSMKGKIKTKGEKNNDETIMLKAIPYYAWNNRGTASMKVWMPYISEAATVIDSTELAMQANASASTDWAPGLNDGFNPSSSSDTDKSYFYWWLKDGSEEWVQYDFDKSVTISSSSVYWLNLDHYDVNYRVPESYQISYQTAKGNWVEVQNHSAYESKLDQYNTVSFDPVKTKAIRITAKIQKGFSAGILEWKLNQ
ncbi:glycoside hydrolase family 127 protein [Plebeiibacterium sediminum]|uniref:Glycoside hydrolase family 127 protein n=1 Tax=Plebeiibacterium sediminum TaxID=2992112 RepID=A0AAE3M3V0_9BACT|nr:beta-L-arabinofuranosidase domain-containing protein [Plebeiobacterium sediminum]MCW3786312.1 glycoside hydrolase family 127 protein [Plebeiobacterium sediminum]